MIPAIRTLTLKMGSRGSRRKSVAFRHIKPNALLQVSGARCFFGQPPQPAYLTFKPMRLPRNKPNSTLAQADDRDGCSGVDIAQKPGFQFAALKFLSSRFALLASRVCAEHACLAPNL